MSAVVDQHISLDRKADVVAAYRVGHIKWLE